MRKGQITKEYIIQKSVPLFNQRGYFGASMSDIMSVTGLQKGGIYNHFSSKDELALEAFDYAIKIMSERYTQAIKGKASAIDQLVSLISIYEDIIENPPIEGGCPILNTAVESDDSHPALHEKARLAMDQWIKLIRYILSKGIKKGEIRPDIDADSTAVFITSTFEGAIMLSKLYNSSDYMRQTIKYLADFFEGHLKA
jgi:TetR/AcrR family transcriptional repressor of nem operon